MSQGSSGAYPSTRASAVRDLGSADPARRAAAYDALARSYWRQVYVYIRLRWHRSADDGQHLAQEFFARDAASVQRRLEERPHRRRVIHAVLREGRLGGLVRLPVEEGVPGAADLDVFGALAGLDERVHELLDRGILDEPIVGAARQELRHGAHFRVRDVAERRNRFLPRQVLGVFRRIRIEQAPAEDTVARRGGLDRLHHLVANLLGRLALRQIGRQELEHAGSLAEPARADHAGHQRGGRREVPAG